MFYAQFPNSFQSLGANPYDQVNGQGQVSPYAPSPFAQGMPSVGMMNSPSVGNMDYMDQYNTPMPGNDTESQLYPMENADSLSNYTSVGQATQGFRSGGNVRHSMRKTTEKLRKYGREGDTILAHINPEEVALLKAHGGSGTFNPHTGLPEFKKRGGLFGNPGKWFRANALPAIGAIGGNMIMPGIGGMIGGTLGGLASSAIRGRSDYAQSALRGLGMGSILPSLAGIAGSGANMLGATGLGNSLTNYGNANAILPALGRVFGGGESGLGSLLGMGGNGGGQAGAASAEGVPTVGNAASSAAKKSFFEKLVDDPKNLLALASVAGQYMTREKPKKEKSAEEMGRDMKAYQLAQMLNPGEIAQKEAYEAELAKASKRSKRNSYLPEERLGDLKMVYPRTASPEDASARGRYIDYYDNPSFAGPALPYARGGSVPQGIMIEEMDVMPSVGNFLRGNTKGQDDKIRTPLEEGGYVLDASTMSDLGDGNSEAGNSVIDAWLSDGERKLSRGEVQTIGHGDHNKGVTKLNKMRKNLRKHKRGGETKLPPKAKPIEKYAR